MRPPYARRCLLVISFLWSLLATAGELDVRIEPLGIDEAQAATLTQLLLDRPDVKQRLKGTRYRIISRHFDEPAENKLTYQTTIYDYTHDKLLVFTGDFAMAGRSFVHESDDRPEPTHEEFEEAVKIIAIDTELGEAVRSGTLIPYEAMPGLVDDPATDSSGRERVIAVGLKPVQRKGMKAPRHEIVGVNLSRERVARYSAGAPPTALATTDHCGFANAGQSTTARGTSGMATITISRDSQTLWQFVVVRPSASSGALGSGVEIRNAYYKGRLVFSRAHVPILNVNYDSNACGPYRDWQYQENAFTANGTNLASGIRRTTTNPQTIFESESDFGNFRGVAVHTSGNVTRLVSELQAAWYRYISEWRFHEDGTVEPIFKFSAVSNSCVCLTHHHHVYWRFDFDIDTAANNSIEAFNGTNWRAITTEVKQFRSLQNRAWRVFNTNTGRGYTITPSPNDGTANTYGRGDAWALHYRSDQIDDSRVRTSTQANIDRFVTAESTVNTDVVFWYAAHFTHNPNDETAPHLVGPVLRPFNWSR